MRNSKKVIDPNYIRISKMTTEDKTELKKLIKKGFPKEVQC